MSEIRLHTIQHLAAGARIQLESAPARHLVQVLRRSAGARVILFNGDGFDYPATIIETGKPDRCLLEVGHGLRAASESPLTLVLVQAVGRGQRMDYAIRKSVELGVSAIRPIMTARTGVRLEGERAAKRLAHWRGVAIAACEQSGRALIPDISPPAQLPAALPTLAGDATRIFLDPSAQTGPGVLDSPPAGGVILAIGPEGGFNRDEKTRLEAAGFSGIRLGPRVLRTETAGPAAIAVLQARFGDLG